MTPTPTPTRDLGHDQGVNRVIHLVTTGIAEPHSAMTWEAATGRWHAYMDAGKRSAGTIRLRLYHLRLLARDHPDPWTVTSEDLVNWLAAQAWKIETIRSIRSSLTGFYGWAHRSGITATNPALMLPILRAPRAVPKPASVDLLHNALLIASERDELILLLGAYAGLRRSEIAALRWDCLTDGGDLHIVGKGQRERLVPIHPRLAKALRVEQDRRQRGMVGSGWRYPPDPASPYVFPGPSVHMCSDAINRVVMRLMPGHSAHQLRHLFATRAYRGTRDIRAVQELLGHSSPTTTARYAAVSGDDLRAAVIAAA